MTRDSLRLLRVENIKDVSRSVRNGLTKQLASLAHALLGRQVLSDRGVMLSGEVSESLVSIHFA